MDKPQAKDIPSFDFLPPLGGQISHQPLSPLGQTKSLSYPLEPLSHKLRRRRQRKNKSVDDGLDNIAKPNNFSSHSEHKDSENTLTSFSPDLLNSGEELLFTPNGFQRQLTESNSINPTSITETKKTILAPQIDSQIPSHQIPSNQSISSQPAFQSDKPQSSSYSTAEVKAIAQEVYSLLRQRDNINRERRGTSSKSKPFF